MPYAVPISPTPSPARDHPFHKPYSSSPIQVDDASGPSFATGPMPGIPRRSSSHQSSGSTTPRRISSPMSRQASAAASHQASPASRPMEGMPRRASGGHSAVGVTGLPSGSTGEGGLGLKLHPSPGPSKILLIHHGGQDSMSSTSTADSSMSMADSSSSTLDSSLPPTPSDEDRELAVGTNEPKDSGGPIPFPAFEPPPRADSNPSPHRATFSPPRPALLGRRGSALGHQRGNGQSGSLQLSFPTVSSASHLSPSRLVSSASSQAIRPTASMIRKKSGEVVKPSLKTRSMSTPDLSRQEDVSEPSTPETEKNRDFPDERSKSVRFADADDGDTVALESVVLFLREQKVTAIGKATDPERSDQVTETETENDTDASDFVQFRTKRNAAARAADEAEKIVLEGGSKVPRIRVDFAPEARGSLVEEYVVLERVELVSGVGPLSLRGSAIVRNASFQKWVGIRFTLDHWQTVSEVAAAHLCHIPSATTGDEGWDRFGFSIKLEDYKRKLDERQLIMCVRFNVDNREWWDSNDGINYNFTFKKAVPKRPSRSSVPPGFGGGYTRLSEPLVSGLPGVKSNRSVSPSSRIKNAFGATDKSRTTGPRDWMFPNAAKHTIFDRPESPMPPPPPASFRAPALPDVYTHLSLSKYCAPSPPQSPPKDQSSFMPSMLGLSSPREMSSQERNINFMGGQYATLAPEVTAHERRSSWSGESESWDSFAAAMGHVEGEIGHPSTDGESTPLAPGSRSPMAKEYGQDSSQDSSPEGRPLDLKRSTGDLRALLTEDAGHHTPPSNVSSPPSPPPQNLLAVTSPSTSAVSTGESSPVDTVSSDSTPDLSNIAIQIDPEERGRTVTPNNYRTLSSASYQEFLDKFCFFQSPRMTPPEDPVYSRPSFMPRSGNSSPQSFPFYTGTSASSRGTPTPTRQYDSAQDAFNFPPHVNANTTPKASPPTGVSPSLAGPQHHPGPTDTRTWARQLHGHNSPSLTAAK